MRNFFTGNYTAHEKTQIKLLQTAYQSHIAETLPQEFSMRDPKNNQASTTPNQSSFGTDHWRRQLTHGSSHSEAEDMISDSCAYQS